MNYNTTRRSIKITFPVKKKNIVDTYRTMATYTQLGDMLCFCLDETNRELTRLHHTITEGCKIQDLITDESYECIKVIIPDQRPKRPIMQVRPI